MLHWIYSQGAGPHREVEVAGATLVPEPRSEGRQLVPLSPRVGAVVSVSIGAEAAVTDMVVAPC